MGKEEVLQELCRKYLGKLRYMASKHGLGKFVDETIELNRQGKCRGTEYECRMLARMVDDERINRADVPKVLGKSYRECCEHDDFDKIKKLKHVGIYSKISAMLFCADRETMFK